MPADLLLFDSDHITGHDQEKANPFLLIANFRLVLNVVFFLPGESPASEFYIPTFRNTLSHIFFLVTLPTKMEGTYKIQTPGNHQKERI